MLRHDQVFLMAFLTSVILSTNLGGTLKVYIDSYTANKSYEPPATVTLPLGTTLVLVCRDGGVPMDRINSTIYNWTYPNKPRIQQGYVGPIIEANVLTINITSVNDSGKYICNVSNEELEGSGNFHLNVKGGEVVHSYGRLILNEGVIFDGWQLQPPNNTNGDGRIECRVSSGEAAKFTYYGSKRNIGNIGKVHQHVDHNTSDTTVVIEQRALCPKNSKFAIEGKCGSIFHYLFLNKDADCYNVTRYVDVTTSDGSMTVTISELPCGIARAIVGYAILVGGVWVEVEYVNLRECASKTFITLEHGDKHRITVWGLSGGDTNNRRRCHSPTIIYNVMSSQLASPPRELALTENEYYAAGGMALNWIPPRVPNGDIMGYHVKCMKNGTEMRVNTTINYYALDGGQTYNNITVMAITGAGYGEESEMRSFKVP